MVSISTRRVRRRALSGRALIVASLLLASSSAAQAADPCGMLPSGADEPAGPRLMTTDDLVRIRDFGAAMRGQSEVQISLSPDGNSLAFMMTRADPATNATCTALALLDLTRPGPPILLSEGGPPIDEPIELRGLQTGYGWTALNLPLWSPDGRSIAFLRQVAGKPQIWVVDLAAGGAHQATNDMSGVERFTWLADGTSLVFANRPGLAAAEKAIDAEGRTGFLLDDRIVPYMGSRPLPRLPVASAYKVVSLVSGEVVKASTEERDRLDPPPAPELTNAQLIARAPAGPLAWTETTDAGRAFAPIALMARDRRGQTVRCDDPACSSAPFRHAFLGLWWRPGGRELVYLRREGWADSQTAVYRWVPGKAPKRVLATDDWLGSCALAGKAMLCLRDGSLVPRQLVAIDLESGASRVLFDPNPAFGAIRQGKVARLHWTNDIGLDAYGDLLLPPDYDGTAKLPLIVVQYDTRGFLRGGVGDEFPIPLFAARGFAVLSVTMPSFYYTSIPDPAFRTFLEAEPLNQRDWANRRSVHSSLMKGIDLALAGGTIDPTRIGLTGLSDGAVAAQFALADRPTFFAAASVSACCSEPYNVMIYGGIALEQERRGLGFPPARGPRLAEWQPVSIAMNADRISTPLLMQLADHSFTRGLESFMALRAAGRPVEMFVFPDEYHLKVQPAHRLAIYERNLDWFDFWLCDRTDADPLKQAQYLRWRQMRTAAPAGGQRPDGPCPVASTAPTSRHPAVP